MRARRVTTQAQTGQRMGRPPKPADEKKGHSRAFRARPALLERLTREAKEANRSFSEEVEYRLQRSFEKDTGRWTSGAEETELLVRMFAGSALMLEMLRPASWLRDKEHRQDLRDAFDTLLSTIAEKMGEQPTDEPKSAVEKVAAALARQQFSYGKTLAERILKGAGIDLAG